MTERYTTAGDMADDLRHFVTRATRTDVSTKTVIAPQSQSVQAETVPAPPGTTPVATPSDSAPVKIVPKGLRSFDEHDADFFLDLLPGPRDREGLPDSIRFWKTRIEEFDTDKTFAVGLIYGPSGCVKSSLVKAGLLPRLSRQVIAVYVEATADDTETRLLRGLKKRWPALPESLSLTDTLAALRRGQGLPSETNKALLPESGTDIKGHMQSHAQLLAASGYASRPADFDDLIRVLDTELRLITPTDPDGKGDADESTVQAGARYYQLTHDYFVPSLRDWLTRKQRETRRGRAELRLAELAGLWHGKPENRLLPNWMELATIRWLTNKKTWSETERRMMRRAARWHAFRAAALLVLISIACLGGFQTYGWFQARALVESLVRADVSKVLATAEQVALYHRWAEPRLDRLVAIDPDTPDARRDRLHARLALVRHNPAQIPHLQQALLQTAAFDYTDVIRQSLAPYYAQVVPGFWQVLHDVSRDDDTRFRAGLALAGYEPATEQWTELDDRFLVEKLVSSNPIDQPVLWKLLAEIKDRLIDPLEEIFVDSERPETHQIAAANALAAFAGRDTRRVVELLLKATPGQYAILYPLLASTADAATIHGLRQLIGQEPGDKLGQAERVSLGQRRAGAAITLLRQGEREGVFDALRVRDDPETLTQFVHRCRARGVTAAELIECLHRAAQLRQGATLVHRKREDRVMYAIVLALGEFSLTEIPVSQRQTLTDELARWYATDPSSAIHGATGWLLRQWGFQEQVTRVDQKALPYDESGNREWYVEAIEVTGSSTKSSWNPTVAAVHPAANAERQTLYFTFVVFPPGEYRLGSPQSEAKRETHEMLHQVTRESEGVADAPGSRRVPAVDRIGMGISLSGWDGNIVFVWERSQATWTLWVVSG